MEQNDRPFVGEAPDTDVPMVERSPPARTQTKSSFGWRNPPPPPPRPAPSNPRDRGAAVLVGVDFLVALFEGGLGDRAGGAGMVMGLEGLEDAVAPVLVDRRLLGDPHPVSALVGLHVEDLLVDRGRVVDDDDDLGLGVEIGAGLDQQLLDLVEVLSGAGFIAPIL